MMEKSGCRPRPVVQACNRQIGQNYESLVHIAPKHPRAYTRALSLGAQRDS